MEFWYTLVEFENFGNYCNIGNNWKIWEYLKYWQFWQYWKFGNAHENHDTASYTAYKLQYNLAGVETTLSSSSLLDSLAAHLIFVTTITTAGCVKVLSQV